MDFNFIAGAVASAVVFIPVFLILAGRLLTNGSLLALSVYYLFTGLYSLMSLNLIPSTLLFRRQVAVMFNYLDTPLMLVVLLFFCNKIWKQQLVKLALLLFLVFEVIIAFWFGLSVESCVYLLGPGTLLVLSLGTYFFLHYGKICIVQGKGQGKTFMLVSIIFSYGTFLILYYLHYLMRTPAVTDVFLIYYIGLFIAAALMSVGLLNIIKRTRAMRELQLARRELALFFNN